MADQDPVEGQDNPESIDLDWIPENFRRDTIEESARALLESQNQAQRKITETTTANRNLETMYAQAVAENEQFRAAQQQQQQQQQQLEPDADQWQEWYANDPIATMRALSDHTVNQRIAELQASQQKDAEAAQVSNTKLVASYALRTLEDRHGKLTEEQRGEMMKVATEYPHLLPPSVTQDPDALIPALEIVYKLAVPDGASSQQSQEELQRTMKMQAQSATGAGGRLTPADEDAQRWQEIMNANTGTWAEATRGK